MGVTVATMRAALNTSTGNQDFDTTDLGGLTPKLAIFIITRAVTDGTAADHAMLHMGATDGTRYWCGAIYSEHNVGSSNTGTDFDTTAPIVILTNAGAAEATASFVEFHTNGVRVNITDAPAAAYLCTVILFAGTDLSVYVGNQALTNLVDTAHDITAPGWEPDNVIAVTANSLAGMGIGFIHNNRASTITQKSNTVRLRGSRPTTESYGKQYSNRGCYVQAGAWASDAACTLEFGTFDSSGFTVTTRQAAPGTGTYLLYIALRYGSSPVVSSKVWAYATPTGTGNATDTTPGFQPQFVMYLPTLHAAVDTYYSDATAGAFGVSVITPNAQFCNTIADEDNQADSDSQSLSDNQAVNLPLDSGAAGMAATYVSMQSTGPQLNWSDVETTARYYVGWAIQVSTTTVTVNLAAAAVSASGQALSVVEGAVTKNLTNASLSATGQVITVSAPPAPRTVNLVAANLVAAGQALSVIKGAVTKALNAAGVTATGQVLTVVEGEMVKALAAAMLTASGQTLTVSAPAPGSGVQLNAATLVASGQTLTVVEGAVTKALNAANITASGQVLSVLEGEMVKALNAANITAQGQSLTVIEGARTIPLGVALLQAIGQALTVGGGVGPIIAVLSHIWLFRRMRARR